MACKLRPPLSTRVAIGSFERRRIAVLQLLGNDAAAVIFIKFCQRMTQIGDIRVRVTARFYRVDSEKEPFTLVIHLLERAFLEIDLPTLPGSDAPAINIQIAVSTDISSADADSLAGFEQAFDQNAQSIRNWIGQLLRCRQRIAYWWWSRRWRRRGCGSIRLLGLFS